MMKHRYAPALETLEDRLMPSTMAGVYADGTWRFDTIAGWAHITAGKATKLDVDDAGNVFAVYSSGEATDGVWRWNASMGVWAKLSDFATTRLQVTAGGVLYGDFSGFGGGVWPGGVWRWSPTTGWSQITNLAPSLFTVSDNDTFFGGFLGSSIPGVWRWTPTDGWSLLHGGLPSQVASDANGSLFEVFSVTALRGTTTRWTPTTGFTTLTGIPSSGLIGAPRIAVSADGTIFEIPPGGGLWRAAPGATSFTQIGSPSGAIMVALPDGSLFIGGAYWNPNIGFITIIPAANTISQAAVGKDGDLFFIDSSSGAGGTGYWSLQSSYNLVGPQVPTLIASQR
jgi:hypothetical protein